ncbi:hypothetical protein GUITHDRAFT_154032 [Guillardia theta CCMP2712]|uniref:Uncharacterized protein n=2 Tax=Guillardia theta TaxID=55529 RepID=L1IXD0_GUITC|nr:hypothetical protein GUITHDRAFT_154032 [Guillardia theta CCMP2712]EKX40876.1 hypothetical protein GUITHDRAFT_154032 [Guillardia theta CCMP2712]|eukprot:XP_005827856.1 hypothetical protein GUITHDRAFT_154032 [Guillardia theta CCMP2712]
MEGSGWNKPEHARWGHVKEWVTEQWQAMMQRREEDRLRRIYEKKMLSNRFFLRAMEDLRQEGKQDEETFKYGGSLNEEQTHALEVARVLASSKIQGVFRGVKLRKGISKLKADLLRQKQERMKARELERQKMKDDSKTFYSKLKFMTGRGVAKESLKFVISSPGSEDTKHVEILRQVKLPFDRRKAPANPR